MYGRASKQKIGDHEQENKILFFFKGKEKLILKFRYRVINVWSMASWIQGGPLLTKTDLQILHVRHFWLH